MLQKLAKLFECLLRIPFFEHTHLTIHAINFGGLHRVPKLSILSRNHAFRTKNNKLGM